MVRLLIHYLAEHKDKVAAVGFQSGVIQLHQVCSCTMDFNTMAGAEMLVLLIAENFTKQHLKHLAHNDFIITGYKAQFKKFGCVTVGPLNFCITAITEEVANG